MGQPISRVLSKTIIYLVHLSPNVSCNLPWPRASHTLQLRGPLFGLAPGGVYPATMITHCAVRSYRTFSPLPSVLLTKGGLFSVALAVDLRLPGVTWHLTLWSPDFPL
jgi:hypothetical protein